MRSILVLLVFLTSTIFGQTIHYVENLTNDWVPFQVQAPVLSQYWLMVPNDTPPPHTLTGPIPSQHEIRPGERYYWVDGSLPAPSPMSDPTWDRVRKFLNSRTEEMPNDLANFTSDVWTNEYNGLSAGSWSQDYGVTFYQYEQFVQLTPNFRRVGWEPWAGGHAAGNHYCSASYALEEYIRTGDIECWNLFVLRTLHVAGQGLNWNTGRIRYESSSGPFCGDSYTGGWPHQWPECVWMFTVLTGELMDASVRLFEGAVNSPHNWQGYYGIRGSAWYTRSLRCLETLLEIPGLPASVAYVHQTLDTNDTLGFPYFPNLASNIGQISVWQQWLFMSEAVAVAVESGDATIYPRILPIAQWMLANAHNNVNGHVPYHWTPANGNEYLGTVLTSYALPMMAVMVANGDLDPAVADLSLTFLLSKLPTGDKRGLRWVNSAGQGTGQWGDAAPKIAATGMYGLRRDVIQVIRDASNP